MKAYRCMGLMLLMVLAAVMVCSNCMASAEASGAGFGTGSGIMTNLFDGKTIKTTTVSISWPEQVLVIISGCVIKPAYMVLSFILILLLRKNRENDLVLINWSLITFLVGEGFCAANFLLAGGESDLFEILHGLGMVGLWIFLPWGLFRLIDQRVLGFSNPDKRCVMSGLCGKCWKTQNVICGISWMFSYAAISLALIALMPLTAPAKPFKILMTVNDVPTVFTFSALVLFFELRVYAILGSIMMLLGGIARKFEKDRFHKSETLFFIGFGFMFYSLFRFVLLACYDGIPQWMNFWEEISELIMISLLVYFLFVFRNQLKIKIPIKWLKLKN